ncbi:MAG: hypothetical protein M3O70_09535 [Actinomycetota bacterium]|nr:hypothetical protein [Actinomycetota bacterium]
MTQPVVAAIVSETFHTRVRATPDKFVVAEQTVLRSAAIPTRLILPVITCEQWEKPLC